MITTVPAAAVPPLPLSVRVLAIALVAWVPLSLALEASSGLTRLLGYGVPAVALLLARVVVAGLAVAAGRALWTRHPAALQLTRTWLVVDLVVTGVTLATPYFPSNRLPGGRWRDFAIAVVANAACLAYLHVSPKVRACWSAR
jgi:hypothetical protein